MAELALEPALGGLLRAAGLPEEAAAVVPLAGGANNRVYEVAAGEERVVLKVYFGDDRPRLHAEFSFLQLARDSGVSSVAAPLARDDTAGMGLYERLPGRRMRDEDVDAAAVELAASLFAAVNQDRELARGRDLPLASEACFSVEGHLALVERRVMALTGLDPRDDVDELARRFVLDRLKPLWTETADRLRAATPRDHLATAIDPAQRCVSPSDFGFHNALIDETRRISFLDFEYAGWDDPAKLVCDFFCQVAVPAPSEHQERFEKLALAPFSAAEEISSRIELLRPVYLLKWTCIVLNDFLAHGRARRSYALGGHDDRERRTRQIHKATSLLDRVA